MQKQQHSAHKGGRPKLGTFRLETILPQRVLDELMRHEAHSGVYRTRVAANVLCEWAKNSSQRAI